MKTTEQLEAMNVMAVDPVARVVAPRFWAGVVFHAFVGIDFQRCRHLRRVFGRRRMAGFGWWYFLVANAKQHYLPLRRPQRLNQIRRFRRGRYVDRRTSGLPLRTDFRRYFARQYTHGSVFRPDHPRRRLHLDRMDVYRLKAV